MSTTTPYSAKCSCACACLHTPHPHSYGLCQDCLLQWCQGSDSHAPATDNSYLGTYGITNIWTGWLISQAPHLVAETPAALLRPGATPRCPDFLCGAPMVRRLGAWKCYHHEKPVVLLEEVTLPRSPTIKVLGVCLP